MSIEEAAEMVGGVQRIEIREGCFRYEMDRREEFILVRRSFALHEETLQRLDKWVWSVVECFYQRKGSRGELKQKNKSRRMPRERGLGAGFESLEDAEVIVSRYFGASIVGGGGGRW